MATSSRSSAIIVASDFIPNNNGKQKITHCQLKPVNGYVSPDSGKVAFVCESEGWRNVLYFGDLNSERLVDQHALKMLQGLSSIQNNQKENAVSLTDRRGRRVQWSWGNNMELNRWWIYPKPKNESERIFVGSCFYLSDIDLVAVAERKQARLISLSAEQTVVAKLRDFSDHSGGSKMFRVSNKAIHLMTKARLETFDLQGNLIHSATIPDGTWNDFAISDDGNKALLANYSNLYVIDLDE